ncbi:HNH endonuclease [Candidatus Micrarchaeota archaeon]|nr:HNH endonuclease [Candidatus Micrarchaeota archaeon]
MKKLYPTFADSHNYRGTTQNLHRLTNLESDALRASILERDKYTCAYCGFAAKEWQTITYLNGNPGDNTKSNLVTTCPMCSLVLNTPLGCQIEGIVELYEKSDYTQNEIVQMTRKLRSEGKTDDQIRRTLGLQIKVPYKMNKEYLKGLYAFVSSWKGSWGQVEEALAYGYAHGNKSSKN